MNEKYEGNDNYGRPKSLYLEKIAAMTDEELQDETEGMIYQSARCNNNTRADWHWMVDACYEECQKREDKDIYKRAYKSIESEYF